MAKETFYFTHDYNARNDDKILELRSVHGAEGYGIFWMIVETMAENSNGGVKATLIGGLSLGYGVAKDRLMAIFNCCLEIGLFYEKEGFYFSRRMLTHKQLRNKLSESGKAGAEKRWGGYSQPNSKGKEIKEKDNKVNTIFKKDFKKFPLAENFNYLPEKQIKASIDLIKLTQNIDASKDQINSFWGVFKIQRLNGENFYENEEKIYEHFVNWIKDKKINNGNKSSTSASGRNVGANELLEDIRRSSNK